MQKNSQDFSMQEALRLAKSPAGQQLLDMLKHADNEQIQKAMQQAATGDLSKAGETLNALLSSPQAQKLLEELRR